MKNKILNTLILIGLVALITLIVLVGFSVVEFGVLWLDYAFLGTALLIFVCLNIKYKRYTEYDEALSCLRRAKRSVSKLPADKDVGYVKLLTVTNQLANAENILEEIAAKRELYALKSALKELSSIRGRYRAGDSIKMRFDKSVLSGDVCALEGIIEEVKKLK